MAKFVQPSDNRKNHIKFAYIFRDKSSMAFSHKNTNPRYLCGYLTDENKLLFDEFILEDLTYFKRSTVYQFLKKIKKRNLSASTVVGYCFGEEDYACTDLIYLLWALYHNAMKFQFSNIPLALIADRINRFTGSPLGRSRKSYRNMSLPIAMTRLNKLYEIVLENHWCPWVNETNNQRYELIKFTRRRMYKIVCMGLFCMSLRDYETKIKAASRMAAIQRTMEFNEGTILTEEEKKELEKELENYYG